MSVDGCLPIEQELLSRIAALIAERDAAHAERDVMRNALKPFASLARQYDERVFPYSPGTQSIGTTLEACRYARVALAYASRRDADLVSEF
jgi:hypothetical protein